MRALGSVWNQDYDPIEIIVVDDASTDKTRQIVDGLNGKGVQLISFNLRKGASEARNAAIYHSSGQYVAFLDADDAWLPNKISQQVKMMEENPQISLVSCDLFMISSSGERKVRSHAVRPPVAGAEAWRTLLAYCFTITSSILVRRIDLIQLGGFNPKLPVGEDLDLWIRLAIKGEVGVIDDVLVYKYDRPRSLMKSCKNGEVEFVLPMIENHLRQLKHRLSEKEIRTIRGKRYFEVGCNLLYEGAYRNSVPLFWRSLVLGYRPIQSLICLLRALLMSLLK